MPHFRDSTRSSGTFSLNCAILLLSSLKKMEKTDMYRGIIMKNTEFERGGKIQWAFCMKAVYEHLPYKHSQESQQASTRNT